MGSGPRVQCCRPQTYASLPAGNWTFEVRAMDAAGNAEAHAWPSHAWVLNISSAYVNLVGGDVGATVTRFWLPPPPPKTQSNRTLKP